MPLVNDAGLDPTNVTYDMAIDGYVDHASATVAVGKKYIANNNLYPDGSSGVLPTGSLALCTATSPETWVALAAPFGMRLADSSTGIIWLRSQNTSMTRTGWDAIEAWLDIVADHNAADVSGPLNTLITTVAAISPGIPIHLGPTPVSMGFFTLGWNILSTVNNDLCNPIICHAPIRWRSTATSGIAMTVGRAAAPTEVKSLTLSEYWIEFGTNFTPDYMKNITGLQITNVTNARFRVRSVAFYLGVELVGNGTNQGTGFNDVDISTYACLKSVGWTSVSGGFVNENTLHHAEGTHNTSFAMDSCCSLRINLDVGGSANGNKWYSGPSFEFAPSPGGNNMIELVGLGTGAAVVANQFYGMRIDTAQPTFIACNGSFSMIGNVFSFAFIRPTEYPTFGGSNAAAATACALNTFELPYFDPRTGIYDAHPVMSFGRSNVTQRMSGGSLLVQAPARGKIYLRNVGAVFANEAPGTLGHLSSDSIQLPVSSLALMGVFLDVRNTPLPYLNKAHFKANLKPGTTSAGRIGIIAYAADGQTIISSANDIQTSAQGIPGTLAFGGTAWGQSGDSTPTTSSFELAWSANVGFIYFYISGGGAPSDFVDADLYTVAESGAMPLYDSLAMPVLGPNLPLIDDDLPYSVDVPFEPLGVTVTNITNSATTPAITTATPHRFATGNVVYISGVPAGFVPFISGTGFSITVTSATSFTISANTSTAGTFTGTATATRDFMTVTGVTNSATAPIITTGAAHGLTVGQTVLFYSMPGGFSALAGVPFRVVTVPSTTTFTIAANTSASGTFAGSAGMAPDFTARGQTVRATLPSGTSGTAAEWVRTAGDTWVARNF